ncbi:MAG: flagellar basal body-associated FliL family protein [candidate division Zixibacteria bacterium]|nr:flagellar basal body-associated FliL family protein [candidate division Zixibacteria bacterium]
MPIKDEKLDPKEPTPAGNETEKKEKKKLPPFVIYIAIGVVAVAAGYFVGTRLMGSSKKVDGKEAAAEDKPVAGKKVEKKDKAEGPSTVYKMDDIIVNPSGTSGTRFLSVSVGFEVGSPETAKLFEERQPLIRDALITILGSKTMEQLSDTKQKEITRYQIKKRIEQLLGIDDLAAVYFTDFVLQ